MERAFVISDYPRLEATDVADRIGVSLAAVVAEVTTGPVGTDAVHAVQIVVGADAIVPAVAADLGLGARQFLLQLSVAVAAASEQLQLVADRVLADDITGGVPLMLDLAIDAGDGDVLILDPYPDFRLDGEVAVQVDAQAPADGAGLGCVAFHMRVTQRSITARLRIRLSKRRNGKNRHSGGGEKNVT